MVSLDPVPETFVEEALLQHEERLQQLERDKPVHEALGNYQDVSRALWNACPHLEGVMSCPEAYIGMYLNVFQRLPAQARCEQAWEVSNLAKDAHWQYLGHFIFHAMRVHNHKDALTFWKSHSPFIKKGSCPVNTFQDFGLVSLNLSAPNLIPNTVDT